VTVAANNTANNDTRFVEMDLRKMRLNLWIINS